MFYLFCDKIGLSCFFFFIRNDRRDVNFDDKTKEFNDRTLIFYSFMWQKLEYQILNPLTFQRYRCRCMIFVFVTQIEINFGRTFMLTKQSKINKVNVIISKV